MTAAGPRPVRRIVVTVQVGDDRMAATDDPMFLGIHGPQGREFRLLHTKGKCWRRGQKDVFVLAGQDDPETNVDRADLNDPAAPHLDADRATGAYLRKGLDPFPNVRGRGEFDDRIQIDWIEVELHAEGREEPVRFVRSDPFWLGLVCGLVMEIPRADGAA